jgi:hypothetical protein
MTDTIKIQGKTYIVMTEGELDQLLRDAKDEGAIIMRDALWRTQVDKTSVRPQGQKYAKPVDIPLKESTIPAIDRR